VNSEQYLVTSKKQVCHSRENGNPESYWIPHQVRNDKNKKKDSRLGESPEVTGQAGMTVLCLNIHYSLTTIH